jgi:hypothetical protein
MLVLALTAVLAVPQMWPSPVKANPVSQTWYLTNLNFSPGVSGADYHMDRGSGNGSSPGDVRVSSGTSKVWAANEASNIVCRMSGGWTVTLYAQSGSPGGGHPDLTVDIGVLSGGTFTSEGTSTTITVSTSGYTNYVIGVTTSGHNINPGDRLALRVNATGNKDILIQTNGVGNSPSYVMSPSNADDYPGTVIVDLTVTDYGSPGINFGSLDSGMVNQPEVAQGSGNGAVKLVIGNDTNINISVQLRGTDFTSGGNSIAVTNVKYNNTNSTSGASTLTASYVTWYSVSAYTSNTTQCYYWISVPSGQTAGNYTATFYYQAVPQ